MDFSSIVSVDYKTAQKLEKRAQFTSGVDTATDSENKRRRKKPSKPKEPCLSLVKGSSSDDPKSDDSIDGHSDASLTPPSDQDETGEAEFECAPRSGIFY